MKRTTFIKVGTLLIVVLSILILRNSLPKNVKATLEKAGKNRIELEKVIKHYSDTGEKQKLRAAYFLIGNMQDKIHFKGEFIERMQYFFEYADTLKEISYEKFDKLEPVFDSVKQSAIPYYNSTKVIHDYSIITSEYLIRNIDSAFESWQNTRWNSSIPFHHFCEYILPYKMSTEAPDMWREQVKETFPELADIVQVFSTYDSAFYAVKDFLKKEKTFNVIFPYKFNTIIYNKSFTNYNKIRLGDCTDESNYRLFINRAFGIPCAYDYLLAWGNRKFAAHSWTKPAIYDYKPADTLIFKNVNILDRRNGRIIPASLHPCTMNPSLENLDIQFIKTVPKVYRKTYSIQKKYKDLNEQYSNEIHPQFKDPYMKDISNIYLDPGNVDITVADNMSYINIAYLCVFEISGWIPVDIEPIKRGTAHFKNIGKNILYLPMYYRNGALHPIESPFILTLENKKQVIAPNSRNTQEVILKRKYPLFSNIVGHGNKMYKGYFSISDAESFKDSTIVYNIDSTPVDVTEFLVPTEQSFKFLKYTIPEDTEWGDVAEIEFFYKKNNILHKLKNKDFKIVSSSTENIKNIFDNDYATFYDILESGSRYVIIKFLDPNKKIVKIRFCPRTDTNFIEPGDTYELLCYWNNNWASLGKKQSTDFILIYNNVPQDALLWLRDLTKGSEERPFIFQNEKQIFY